jgi:branched-chain amino acid transport system substrate-binding protein
MIQRISAWVVDYARLCTLPIGILVPVLASILLPAAVSSTVHAQPQSQVPIKIGVSVQQTGQYAELGQTVHRAQQLCVKQANERGGVLGRRLELIAEDDQSQPANAARIYEKMIEQDKIDAVFSPFSSPITEAVANVTEKHKLPLIACCAASSSIFKKGRRFIFMLLTRGEEYLEGFIEIAAKRGLKTLAIIHEDTVFPKTVMQGAVELAKKRGLRVSALEAYPAKTTEFAAILAKINGANPDAIAAITYFNDSIAIARQLKDLNINPKMFAVTVGGDFPKFYETLGRTAEYVYGPSQWEPELVTLRAGGLVPIAREYPGAREFVEAYRKEFPGAELSYQTAQGYGGCQVLLEAIRQVGSLDGEKVRAAILKMNLKTAFGSFKVDQDGLQVAHKMVIFQWQDGKKAIVWPEELAVNQPRFPAPPWNKRP